ncbi:MAG: beta-phosphoglucomutase, partial [Acholeplasmataceae bacterium]
MNRIKLAIFDLDGVITSTTKEHFTAWSELFKRNFDIDLSPELEVHTRGVSTLSTISASPPS